MHIGVDARSRLCFSSRNLGALFEVLFVGLNIMNLKLFDAYRIINSRIPVVAFEYQGDIRVGCHLSTIIGIDRLEKNNFEVVSYPTNNLFLCSPLDRNFGVILHHTLRDGYMIQLY